MVSLDQPRPFPKWSTICNLAGHFLYQSVPANVSERKSFAILPEALSYSNSLQAARRIGEMKFNSSSFGQRLMSKKNERRRIDVREERTNNSSLEKREHFCQMPVYFSSLHYHKLSKIWSGSLTSELVPYRLHVCWYHFRCYLVNVMGGQTQIVRSRHSSLNSEFFDNVNSRPRQNGRDSYVFTLV